MSKSIPDRWMQYKAFGEVIKGTKILAFKVPLKEGVNNNLKPEQRFTTASLLQAFPHLKYIVDLTNTHRYYDKQEFVGAGVTYQKLMLPGREVPSLEIVKNFFKLMDDFLSACGKDDIIGVHCTHGINRTGYLICRYLVQQLGWELEDSLKAFGEARGYPIERDIYLNALKQVKRGDKIDTSKIKLAPSPSPAATVPSKKPSRLSLKHHRVRIYPMGPPGFAPPRRPFPNDGPPFPPQHFGFGNHPPPGFGPPMPPPPPGMPPIPPPPGRSHYGPRPFKYGMPPMRPPVMPPPPGPGYPIPPGFPLRMPGPPLRPPVGGPRLPPGPPPRLPPPKMPPPPSVVTPRAIGLKRLNSKNKQHMRNGAMQVRNPLALGRRGGTISRVIPKMIKEQDFTVDTFEENLLAVSTRQQKRPNKKRFNSGK